MEKEGWGSLLGVGQGSVRDSVVVAMHWKGASGGAHKDPVCFVGKGVCFDTGGISLKPAGGMEDMKWDMGGAAAVSGLMKTLAARKAKANVVGLIGLVENMPDGNAQRPGDIVTSLSVRPSRCSTPTQKDGWCWRTCSGTRRSSTGRGSSSTSQP